jgi:hypothetical protein
MEVFELHAFDVHDVLRPVPRVLLGQIKRVLPVAVGFFRVFAGWLRRRLLRLYCIYCACVMCDV